MTQQTLDFIHTCYQTALKSSKNIIEIIENLYALLADAEVPEEDSKAFDIFIDGLRNCLRIRKMTSDITDIVTYITITIMHIIRWLNQTKGLDIDINLHGRRKSLESDLTKLLRKSTKTLSAKIRDRFGLRGIIVNESEEISIEYIYLIYDSITGILAAKNRKMRKDFIEWVESSGYVNPINKDLIGKVLDIPFDIDGFKDYIKDTKENGYQSLHFTLTIQPYSDVIPGSQLEIQLRTMNMDNEAKFGNASHQKYKLYLKDDSSPYDDDDSDSSEEISKTSSEENSEDFIKDDNPLLKVFVVDDFSKLNILGFTSYNSKEDDDDGIHFCKEFADRRISNKLTPPAPNL